MKNSLLIYINKTWVGIDDFVKKIIEKETNADRIKSCLIDAIDHMDSWELIEFLEKRLSKEEIIDLGYRAEWEIVHQNDHLYERGEI